MNGQHPKIARRRILMILYEAYFKDPLDMLSPQDLMEDGTVSRDDLVANAHYLGDRGLIELMIGYSPPLFAAARITAKGIDLVENQYEFSLLFPPEPGAREEDMAELPVLVERLFEEAECSALDGEARKCLLRDVQFLRDEIARPEIRWRENVIEAFLDWITGNFVNPDEVLPSALKIRELLAKRPKNKFTNILKLGQ